MGRKSLKESCQATGDCCWKQFKGACPRSGVGGVGGLSLLEMGAGLESWLGPVGLLPGTPVGLHTAAYYSSSQSFDILWPLWAAACVWCIYSQGGTHIHINKIQLKINDF